MVEGLLESSNNKNEDNNIRIFLIVFVRCQEVYLNVILICLFLPEELWKKQEKYMKYIQIITTNKSIILITHGIISRS